MLLRTKALSVAGAVAIIVGCGSVPANAVIKVATGTLTCGGSNFPTVRYKIDVATQTDWYDSSGVEINGRDYPALFAVNSQANTQGPDQFRTLFASGHKFMYYTTGCH